MKHGVYPRACGGTRWPQWASHETRGLSPRVRGNPILVINPALGIGSIPARAGEPGCGPFPRHVGGVYPRACGGTASGQRSNVMIRGLSPRVRGNPPHSQSALRRRGSIPARAGEPRPPADGGLRSGVYPRACGGTPCADAQGQTPVGLSPRVRGNQPLAGGSPAGWRSIPARAGEPRIPSRPVCPNGVYPRACGGTAVRSSAPVCPWGLSPRVRGNRSVAASKPLHHGSIPARAGEPQFCTLRQSSSTVYPRACGGTNARFLFPQEGDGLSPRVRGNPQTEAAWLEQERSIPARAGEPVHTH